jgi:hypothetical protein
MIENIDTAHALAIRYQRVLNQAATFGHTTVFELHRVPAGIMAVDLRSGDCASDRGWGRAIQLLRERLGHAQGRVWVRNRRF